MNFRSINRYKKKSNISILSETLKEIAKEDDASQKPPSINEITSRPASSKREVTLEGNGIIEKQMKKGPVFINFKHLLTC